MNGEELDIWKAQHCDRFPQVGRWLEELGESAERAQIMQWLEDLDDVLLEDACEVSRKMHSQELDHVKSWDHQHLGAVVAKAARRLAYARKERNRPILPRGTWRGFRTDEGPITMRRAVEKVERLVKSGRTGHEAAVEIGLLPIDPPKESAFEAFNRGAG